jgi:hypothetical protein
MITINSNGPGKAQPIENLLALLATEPLDPRFEKFGNFYEKFPEMADGSKSTVPNYFFGNFFNVSHVFSIDIDEEDDATAFDLLAAIRGNQATAAYRAAKKLISKRAYEVAKKAKGA